MNEPVKIAQPIYHMKTDKFLPVWLTYVIFLCSVTLVFILLVFPSLLPVNLDDAYYRLNALSGTWASTWYIVLLAAACILVYVVYFLMWAWPKTAIRPIRVISVPLIERLILGPLSLGGFMFFVTAIQVYFLKRQYILDDNYLALATITLPLIVLPVVLTLHGILSFIAAQRRKTYAIIFWISIGLIAAMPFILRFSEPLSRSFNERQQTHQEEKIDEQIAAAQGMKDCAAVNDDFGWVGCISEQMKSTADYLECLRQAPSKRGPADTNGVEYLCDREYRSFVDLYTGRVTTDPTGQNVQHGIISISECATFVRYEAWAACVRVSTKSPSDYQTCIAQGKKVNDPKAYESSDEACARGYAEQATDAVTCRNTLPASMSALCPDPSSASVQNTNN